MGCTGSSGQDLAGEAVRTAARVSGFLRSEISHSSSTLQAIKTPCSTCLRDSRMRQTQQALNWTKTRSLSLDFETWKNKFSSEADLEENSAPSHVCTTKTKLIFQDGRKFIVAKFINILYINVIPRVFAWSLYQFYSTNFICQNTFCLNVRNICCLTILTLYDYFW